MVRCKIANKKWEAIYVFVYVSLQRRWKKHSPDRFLIFFFFSLVLSLNAPKVIIIVPCSLKDFNHFARTMRLKYMFAKKRKTAAHP